LIKFNLKERTLGIAEDTGRYDLPFNQDESTDFLMLLVALMTFLAVMALTSSFVLGGMAERWSSGLENRLTIEIPAEKDKAIRPQETIRALEDRVAAVLRNNPAIVTFDIMEKAEIQELLEPWLGKDALIDTVPLPGLISVQMASSEPETLDKLKTSVQSIDESIAIDTHESWLQDLLRLTGTLQFATFIITLIIGGTTVMAVAGGVRSRMAIYRADVELLHLMGASDEYITRQFQRHTLILALKGGISGAIGGGIIIVLIRLFSDDAATGLLPDFHLNLLHILLLLATPLIGAMIAALTARLTVLRALSQMP
jgi:cell division transport system permease protein